MPLDLNHRTPAPSWAKLGQASVLSARKKYISAGPEIKMGKKKSQLSLSALVQGFVLTLKTEGKAASTVEFLQGNLRRFLWYANQKG